MARAQVREKAVVLTARISIPVKNIRIFVRVRRNGTLVTLDVDLRDEGSLTRTRVQELTVLKDDPV